MANVAGNPMVVDDDNTTLSTSFVHVRKIRWTGATTAGHTAILTNTAGAVVWTSVASGANYVEESTPNFSCQGLKVTTLASGVLYLYFG